jgi:hypothetical protein
MPLLKRSQKRSHFQARANNTSYISQLIYWLGRQGSNLGMPESKSGALPLGDAPTSKKK